MTEPGNSGTGDTGILPEMLGSFEVVDEVGAGPRGTVFRVRKGGRRLALKLFEEGVELDVESLERLRRGSAEWIRHPNLLPVEEIGEVDGRTYYSMRFLAGDSLRTVLEELRSRSSSRPFLSPLSVGPGGEIHPGYLSHAVDLVVEVAEGLEFAHAASISHGRVGPDNLIYSSGGHLVLTDFGGRSSKEGPEGINLSAIPYRAPEQLIEEVDIETCRSDVYALGAILYEFAALEVPSKEKLRDVRSVREGIPDSLAEVIHRAMSEMPEERYSSAGRLAEDLRRFRRGEPTVAAESVSILRATRDPVHPPRRLVLRWSAALVLLALTVVTLQFTGGSNDLSDWTTLRSDVMTVFNRGDAPSAIEKISQVEAERPDDPRPRDLRRHIEREAAWTHLVRAARARNDHDLVTSTREVLAAKKFISDADELSKLQREVEDLAHLDEVHRDLYDPRDEVRNAALAQLYTEISGGRRDAKDVALATGSLFAASEGERSLAFTIFREHGSGKGILEAIGVGFDKTATRIDLDGFARLTDTLGKIDDFASRQALARWSLNTMQRLDRLEPGESVSLAPNLVVEARREGNGTSVDGRFLEQWINSAARSRPDDFVERVDDLREGETSESQLIESLAEAATSSEVAVEKLVSLTKTRAVGTACESIEALAQLREARAITRIARGDATLVVRAFALEQLGENFLEEGFVRGELEEILASGDNSELRTIAFRYLSRFSGDEGWNPQGAILASLSIPDLEDETLAWFDRIAEEWRRPIAMELLLDPSETIQTRAVDVLADDLDAARFTRLLLYLGNDKDAVKEAAFKALYARDDFRILGEETAKRMSGAWDATRVRAERAIARILEITGATGSSHDLQDEHDDGHQDPASAKHE